MKRYYICKVIGNGDIDAPHTPTTGPYRPAIADIVDQASGIRAFSWTQELAMLPNGTPKHDWVLCIAAGTGKSHALAAASADIDPVPDFALDVKLASMHVPTKNQMFSRMRARGISTDAFANADGFRDVLREIGKLHNPNFDETSLDAQE